VVDVARHAGVSTATVSRVLNSNPRVDPAIADRVRSSVNELGYRMNSVARSLRRQSNSVVGVLVPDIANPFFTDVVRGIGDALRDDGYMLILCNSDDDSDLEASYLRLLAAQQVSGVIVAPADSLRSDLSELTSTGVPVVVIDRLAGSGDFDSVVFDNRSGASQLTTRFLEAGRTRVAHIAGPLRTFTGSARREGYRAALETAGVAVDESLVVEGDYSEEGGYRAARALLAASSPPDAIVIANNAMTLGAIRALTELGVDPATTALASFDPVPWSTSQRYSLAVLDHETMRMGVEAAELLLARIDDPTREPEARRLSAGTVTVFAD
jgi:LacI family transcriptional regulator